jgi:hypothetical protein
VTSGGNNVFRAGPGYDQSTGLGTPVAGLLAPALAYDNLAPWLGISVPPPSVVTAGQPFDLTVEVEDADGRLDANFAGWVTIGLADDPGGDALGGMLTAPVVGGFATFNGLTLTHAADGYTIRAVSGAGPAEATTAPFAVAPAAATGLEIAANPAGGPPGLTVLIVDAYGNVETSFSGAVTVRFGAGSVPKGPGHHSQGAGLTAAASGGVATFTHIKPPPASRGRIVQATAAGLTAQVSLPRSALAQARPAHAHPAARPTRRRHP